MVRATVGELLRRYRAEMGLTQQQVGNLIGYNHSLVSRIERGLHKPSHDYLAQFSKALSLSAAEHEHLVALLDGTDEKRSKSPKSTQTDWGTCPVVTSFYGRSQQLALLDEWAFGQKINLIGLFGLDGIGKTYLAARFARSNQSQFDFVFWRTMTSPFPAIDLISELITSLSEQLEHPPSQNIGQAVHQLKSLLESRRCLIVLDNFESVLDVQQVGKYQSEFKEYGYLIDQIARSDHQSCVVKTSRYKPDGLSLLEGKVSPVRTCYLEGLDNEACLKLLRNKNISVTPDESEQLRSRYSGNALLLEIVAEMICDVYGFDVSAFLRGWHQMPERVEDVVQEQISHLSKIQQKILIWMAIERQPLTIQDLDRLISPFTQETQIASALQYLKRRSLIESSAVGFFLQNVIMDCQLSYLVDRICEEINTGHFDYLGDFPLLSTHAPEFIQDAQKRLLHWAIINQLASQDGSYQQVEHQLRRILSQLQTDGAAQSHQYLAGNVLNLLITLGVDLSHCDLSRLTIQKVDFRDTHLHDVNLSNAALAGCIFHETFGHVLKVAFSANGRYYAAATANGNIHIWETATHNKIQILDVDENWVRSFDWHPTREQMLVTSSSGQTMPLIQIWNITSDQPLQTLHGHHARIRSVAYSFDGAAIVTGSEDESVRIWDARTGECLLTLFGHKAAVWSVAFHPNNHLIATAGVDHVVRVWDIHTKAIVQKFDGHGDWVTAVTFNTDGTQLATASKDQTIRLWSTDTGQCEAVLQGHTGWVRSIAYATNDQFLVSASADKTIRIWDLKPNACKQVMTGHDALVESVAFSPDDQHILSGASDQTIRVWHRQSGQCIHKMTGYKNPVWSVKFIKDDSQIVSGSSDGAVRVWDVQTRKQLHTLDGHSDWAKTIAVHPYQNLIASGSSDKTIILWNSETWQIKNKLEGHSSWISSIAFSPDGKLLASGSGDHTVCLWDVRTGEQVAVLNEHEGRIWCVRFSPDGRFLATASDDATIRIWELDSNRCLSTLTHHSSSVYALAFNPDGNQLVSGGNDHTLQIWDLIEGRLMHTISVGLTAIWDITYVSSQKLFAVALSDHTIQMIDAETFQVKEIFRGHKRPVWGIDFSGDEQYIISCGDDDTIKMWDVETGYCFFTLMAKRPYEHLNITRIEGLSFAQEQSLLSLGAVKGFQPSI